jgi:DNA-binding NtrC family response regulator
MYRALGLFHMSSFVQEAAVKEGGLPGFVPIAMPPRRASGPMTALLVDDDDQVRGFCRSLLTKKGVTVFEAHNGLEALLTSVQHQGAIDLLITDLVMPGISGMELGRAFNDLWPNVSVLYISASPRDTFGDQLPADCVFLAKPFAPDALVDAVGHALMHEHGSARKLSDSAESNLGGRSR